MADGFSERYGDLLYGSYDTVDRGVFLILVARAIAPVWEVTRSAGGVLVNLAKKRAFVNHYSFHIMDPQWGHMTIKCPGTHRSGRRSSSTATSTSPPPRGRPGSGSSRRATASPGSPTPPAWLTSQTPCRSPRR